MKNNTIPRTNQKWKPEVKRFWHDILNEFEFDDSLLTVLRTAANALQRLLDAQEIIDKEGLTFTSDSGVIKKHPAIEVEKVSRAGFLQAFKTLNLDYFPDERRPAHRPTSSAGNKTGGRYYPKHRVKEKNDPLAEFMARGGKPFKIK